jgi:hypothetical protein
VSEGKDSFESLMERFDFLRKDVADDPRIHRLLNYKLVLDRQITQLIEAGHRGKKVTLPLDQQKLHHLAELVGLEATEIDVRFSRLLKAIVESRACIAAWRPKKAKANA